MRNKELFALMCVFAVLVVAIIGTRTAQADPTNYPVRIVTVATNDWQVSHHINMGTNTLTIGAGGIDLGTNTLPVALDFGDIYAIDTGAATQLVWIVGGVTNVLDPDGMTP